MRIELPKEGVRFEKADWKIIEEHLATKPPHWVKEVFSSYRIGGLQFKFPKEIVGSDEDEWCLIFSPKYFPFFVIGHHLWDRYSDLSYLGQGWFPFGYAEGSAHWLIPTHSDSPKICFYWDVEGSGPTESQSGPVTLFEDFDSFIERANEIKPIKDEWDSLGRPAIG